MVLGAFYFTIVKVALLSFFNKLESRYSISIFLTILSMILYNFVDFDKAEWTISMLFFPLNIIGTFLFYVLMDERARKFCSFSDVYDISVYAENCKTSPSCCGK